MKNGLFLLLISLFFFGAPNNTTAAEFYKWVDKNGNLHISDKKPPTVKKTSSGIDIVHYKSKAVPRGPELTSKDLVKFRGLPREPSRSDTFMTLDRSNKWGFWNGKKGSVTTENQSLLLTAKGGTNLHLSKFTAPILFQKIKGVEEFSKQVSIEYKGKDTKNSSGIVLFTDNMKKWLAFYFVSGQGVGWKDQDGNGNEIPYQSDYITLKIFQLGGKSFLYYVEDGEWKFLVDTKSGSYDDIGLFAFSWFRDKVTSRFRNVIFTIPSKSDKKAD